MSENKLYPPGTDPLLRGQAGQTGYAHQAEACRQRVESLVEQRINRNNGQNAGLTYLARQFKVQPPTQEEEASLYQMLDGVLYR